LTPADRFDEDKNVPKKTRYKIPMDIVKSTFGASVEEANSMDAWDKEMARISELLKKEKCKDGDKEPSNPGTSCVDVADIIGSQQSEVSVADFDNALNTDRI
jgi:hypothetical protein